MTLSKLAVAGQGTMVERTQAEKATNSIVMLRKIAKQLLDEKTMLQESVKTAEGGLKSVLTKYRGIQEQERELEAKLQKSDEVKRKLRKELGKSQEQTTEAYERCKKSGGWTGGGQTDGQGP